jgi:AcrR family transcriptional regulator
MAMTSSRRPRGETSRGKGRPSRDHAGVGRDALIEATRSLLRERPAAKVTRVDIARFAGVDPGLIRYYFGNKDGLLAAAALAVSRDVEMGGETASDAAEASAASFQDRIRERIRRQVGILAENPQYHQLIAELAANTHDSRVQEAHHAVLTQACQEWDDLLREGERLGVLRWVDPRLLHVAISGMTDFFVNNRTALAGMLDATGATASFTENYTDFIADLVMRGIASQSQGGPTSGNKDKKDKKGKKGKKSKKDKKEKGGKKK